MITYWTKFLNWEVLTEDGLKHIAEHKYKSGVYTPLDNIMNPVWVQLTEYLPRKLAPNLVTFSGFLPLVVSYALCWWCCPDYNTPPPRWLCFTLSLSLLWYQTFDAMDGKQARRLNESTPLGQLFDHGCDCMACLSHHSMAAILALPGGTAVNLGGLAALQTGFFMAQWQEHYLGVLYTSFGAIGVTETQYGLIGAALLGGIAGPERLTSFAQDTSLLGRPMGSWLILAWIMFCCSLMAYCLWNTMTKAPTATDVAASRLPGPQRRSNALVTLVPVLALNFILLFVWHPDVVSGMPRVLCLCAGLLFFYFTAQMIIFTMACMPFNPVQPALLPFALLALASRLAWIPGELLAVKVTLVLFTIGLALFVMAWILTVIGELKGHLKISIFFVSNKAA